LEEEKMLEELVTTLKKHTREEVDPWDPVKEMEAAQD
jgi:hypothetical protein